MAADVVDGGWNDVDTCFSECDYRSRDVRGAGDYHYRSQRVFVDDGGRVNCVGAGIGSLWFEYYSVSRNAIELKVISHCVIKS